MPFSPVRRLHVDQLFGFGIDPAAVEAAAWKDEFVSADMVDDG